MNKKGLIICLVDDDRIYQFTARKTLESITGVDKILVFSNGEEAVSFLKQKASVASGLPDVVFLDINMPVMDGWGFLEAFDRMSSTPAKPITIFMVSSSVDDSDIRRSREFKSIARYVNKPVNREKFEELLSPFIHAVSDS